MSCLAKCGTFAEYSHVSPAWCDSTLLPVFSELKATRSKQKVMQIPQCWARVM